MNTKVIRQLADVTLNKYRSSIPRKAFEEFVKDIITGEIIAALAEQFGGTFATEDQLTTALSFMLGTLRATREKEARHE